MGRGSDYQYHIERARAEMDRAYQAEAIVAAAAHMKLSALHMARARPARTAGEQACRPQASGAPDAA